MIPEDDVPEIAPNELLARFILHSNEMRKDGSVTEKLFLPYKQVELSVNRHRQATTEETWSIGAKIAVDRGKKLYGRADVKTDSCRFEPLSVLKDPIIPGNPNHALIVGFPPPPRKEDQMAIAKRLAAEIVGNWIPSPSE